VLVPNPNYVRDNKCSCPDGPLTCIKGSELVTLHTFKRGRYKDAPRLGRELSVSVFRGEVSAKDATGYVRFNRPPLTEKDKAKIAVRRLSVGKLREAGLVVVHTPGSVEYPEHVSVVWPPRDPVDYQDADWPAEIRAGFTSCFTGEEEGWEE
jgi:hypothetical protein